MNMDLNNPPKCGACAEQLFCGSTMHEHDDDCPINALKLRKRVSEPSHALAYIRAANRGEFGEVSNSEIERLIDQATRDEVTIL
jgi:hypothetical protein